MNFVDTSSNRKWWALGALTLGVLAIGLDATVLSVALPTLAVDLNASTSSLQWFVSSYTLFLAIGMLPGGLMGDRFGRKKVLLMALALFAAGSVACAYSPSAGAFIAARSVLGLSAAFVVPLSLSVLTVLFSKEERPRAVGVWAAANFLALPVGPILGGWLLSNFWWGWVFLMNLPVVAVGMIAVVLLVPESRSSEKPGLDPASLLSSVAGLALLTYGFIEAGQNGWLTAAAMVSIILGTLVLVGFALRQEQLSRKPGGQPLVDPELFKSRGFTWGTILAGILLFTFFGILFIGPQYFQAILATDAMGSGLRLLPLMGGLLLGATQADRISARAGAKVTAAVGFFLLAAGLAAGALTSVASGDGFIAAWTAVCGAGAGLALATAASAVLVELPEEEAGVGSAVFQAVQKTGAPLAAAILGGVLNSVYQGRLDLAKLPPQTATAVKESVFAGEKVAAKLGSMPLLESVKEAFVHGVDIMLLTSSILAALGVILTLIFMPRRVAGKNSHAADQSTQSQV